VLALRSVLRFVVLLWLVGPGGVALADWLGSYAAVQCVLALAVVVVTLTVLRRAPKQRARRHRWPRSRPCAGCWTFACRWWR